MNFAERTLRRLLGVNPVAWAGYARRMRRRFREFEGDLPANPTGQRILAVVTPWDKTGVPWLTIAIGLMLGARGARVTFIVDDVPFGPRPMIYGTVLRAIRAVMRDVARRFEVLHLSQIEPLEGSEAPATIDRLSKLNAVWELRGERAMAGRAEVEARNRRALDAAYGRIARILASYEFDALFTAGGIYGNSGIWVDRARARGLRIISFDNSGFGTWMIAVDGLACHLDDVPRAVRIFEDELDHAGREQALTVARGEVAKRQKSTDTVKYQVAAASGDERGAAGAMMLALNSSWDAAALGIHELFHSNQQWIVETVRHLLDTTEAPVIVRQHPAERFDFAKTTDDYGALLAEHFGSHPRLRFIAAADPVNSYALMKQVAAVIVHSSTIGSEAAAMGRPVITASRSYYAGLGFVWQASTLVQYHQYLTDAVEGRLEVSEAMREKALLCYYTAQICNWVRSTCNPEAFKTWSLRPLRHWYDEATTVRALDAMISGIPVAVLNHRARAADAAGGA
ncbi:hypothetical protein [Sphingomonas sp. MMS24-J13]|uniref:capsular polysaccharide export protein, LipB/KpsS family n=1 Tax=Sphingomonas sp. MMS24-J13 TaxID=3238686 RepID=UPI00384B7BD6